LSFWISKRHDNAGQKRYRARKQTKTDSTEETEEDFLEKVLGYGADAMLSRRQAATHVLGKLFPACFGPVEFVISAGAVSSKGDLMAERWSEPWIRSHRPIRLSVTLNF
jgi:hypothetical protein